MIIGLTGRNGAGKGVMADYLARKSFEVTSLSDIIREELRARGEPITRERLIEAGRELRATYGPAVLAERTLARLAPHKHYVIDSIRHPAEVEALRSREGFVLVAVEAPLEVRFERNRERNREADPQSLEAFRALEEAELESPETEGQQLRRCEAMAERVVVNDSTLAVFHDRIDQLVRMLSQSATRPGWDEYFMSIAQVVASRSNCLKRKVAAIIVKDRRIISTGYNGTPRGTRNCNEGGCPRCNDLAPAGTALEECLCSHAEENAITQAAYHGISVRQATLYSTYSPCLMCTKMIINAGIDEVVYNEDYPLGARAQALLKEAGVTIRQLHL
ncbi:MAG: deaminase [Candidatus Tectimicrobiota bacterium]